MPHAILLQEFKLFNEKFAIAMTYAQNNGDLKYVAMLTELQTEFIKLVHEAQSISEVD